MSNQLLLLIIGIVLAFIFLCLMAAKEMIDEADKCEICHGDTLPYDRKTNICTKCGAKN